MSARIPILFFKCTRLIYAEIQMGFWIGGGSRAFRTTPQVPKGWPSWFAGAPHVASAPSGPGFGTFAG